MSATYLPVEQVAKRYHTTPAALYSQRHRGQDLGALGVKVGRRILWSEADLEKWWESQRAEANR